MDKRYQVFVSSTFNDLIEERRQVTSMLMKMNCIPAGMELFPAVDLEQFQFIKKLIDDSDYYIILIAGKYGSIAPETGVSYTEMEYDYAVEKGKKIIALLHRDINKLTRSLTEEDPVVAGKLENFRAKVSTNRLVNYWLNQDEIPGHIAVSLTQTKALFPAEGWVRANGISSESLLLEINELRKENSELKDKINIRPSTEVPNIAELSDGFELRGEHSEYSEFEFKISSWEKEYTWETIFSMLSPIIITPSSTYSVKKELAEILSLNIFNELKDNIAIDLDIFNKIKVQMMCYELIDIQLSDNTNGDKQELWSLTNKGRQQMILSASIKK